MIWPSRKVNLGNYSTVDLNAGIEMVFDKPVNPDSNDIKTALDKARAIIKEEMGKQYAPYKEMIKKASGKK